MKKILFIALIIISINSIGQNKYSTKIEEVENSQGVLLQEDTKVIGSINTYMNTGKLRIISIKITDIKTSTVTKGVKLNYNNDAAYIDLAELDATITALEKMLNISSTKIVVESPTYSYRTKSDCLFHLSNGTKWGFLIFLNSATDKGLVSFFQNNEIEALSDLITYLKTAKSQLTN